ncbi:DUF2125 domain-containing protein [Rhodobacteraceae bacterium NNCM2]|nr:DUF2125 domain-containing protein [Coraliihabitans acroporae]
MKKFLVIAGSLVVGSAVIWAVLWNAGREEIVERMDVEIKALAASGTIVDFKERIIGGFPFGYSVTLKEVTAEVPAAQSIYFLPKVVSSADITDTDRLTTVLPEKFSMEVLTTAEMLEANPDLPESFKIDFETRNAEVVADGLPDAKRTLTGEAESLLMVFSDQATASHVAIEFQGLATNTVLPAWIEGRAVDTTGAIGLVDYVIKGVAETGAAITIEGQVEDVTMSGTSSLRSAEDLEAMLNGNGTGELSSTFTTGKAITHFSSQGTEETPPGDLKMTTGTSSGHFRLIDGSAEVRAESRNLNVEMVAEDAGPFRETSLRIDVLDAIYQVPFAPSQEMKPFDVKFGMTGLALDDKLWDALDSAGTLDRSPAEFILDAEGTMRLTKPQAETRPGEAPPVAFGNLSINQMRMSALGAYATAEGDIEFLQPVNLPNGTVTLRTRNLVEAMSALVDTGVLTPDILLVASLMVQNYLRPDDATGEMVGEIEMGTGGITINGQPLQ